MASREPPPFNTLTQDEEESAVAVPVLALPLEFIDSKHQRSAGDDMPGTFCPDWVARVTGANKAELLVLAQIAFWFAYSKQGKLKVTVSWHDRWWVYKTYKQLAADLRYVLDAHEVRWAIRTLEKKGVLLTDYDPKRKTPKLYRINPTVVGKLDEAARRQGDASDGDGTR